MRRWRGSVPAACLFLCCVLLRRASAFDVAVREDGPVALNPGQVVGGFKLLTRLKVLRAPSGTLVGMSPLMLAETVFAREARVCPAEAAFQVQAIEQLAARDRDSDVVIDIPAGSSHAADACMHEPDGGRQRHQWELRGRVGQGHYGELWSATRSDLATPSGTAAGAAAGQGSGSGGGEDDRDDGDGSSTSGSNGGGGATELFVVKRLFVEKGEHVRLSGLREIHFGEKLRGQPHTARFVESFEEGGDLFLVFHHEGVSLSEFLYARAGGDARSRLTQLAPSANWFALKADSLGDVHNATVADLAHQHGDGGGSNGGDDGSGGHDRHGAAASSGSRHGHPRRRRAGGAHTTRPQAGKHARGLLMRDLMRQIISGVAVAHSFGVTHRDLKPANLLLQPAFLAASGPDDPQQSASQQPASGSDSAAAAVVSAAAASADSPLVQYVTPPQGSDKALASTDAGNSESAKLPALPDTVRPSAASHALAALDTSDAAPLDAEALVVAALRRSEALREASLQSLMAAIVDAAAPALLALDANATAAGNASASAASQQQLQPEALPPPAASWAGSAAQEPPQTVGALRVADFGSAVDDESLRALYDPDTGPTKLETTLAYAPPEVVFGNAPYSRSNPQSFDIWSAGVLFLELILGSPKAFQLEERTRAIIESRLAGQDAETKEKAALFRALIEYCVYDPALPDLEEPNNLFRNGPCTEADLQRQLQQFDPTGIGAPSIWAVRLIRRLLAWRPELRLSAEQALQHAYFAGPHRCGACGAEFELPAELERHQRHAGHDEP